MIGLLRPRDVRDEIMISWKYRRHLPSCNRVFVKFCFESKNMTINNEMLHLKIIPDRYRSKKGTCELVLRLSVLHSRWSTSDHMNSFCGKLTIRLDDIAVCGNESVTYNAAISKEFLEFYNLLCNLCS